MRDNFSLNVKNVVAQRVAYLCSNPKCQRLTVGPQADESKALNLGVCSHITAAARGGPRYNPKLSLEERRSIDNAIWLCQYCAKLIDNDELRYPVEEIYRWKKTAEQQARNKIEGYLKEITNSEQGVIWTWNGQSHTYRNLQTGEIVDPRKLIELRDRYFESMKDSIDESVDELFDQSITIEQWQRKFEEDLKSTYLIAFMLAIGGKNNLTNAVMTEISLILEGEYQTLADFAKDIYDEKYSQGDLAWGIKHAKLRARVYIDTVQAVVKWP